MSRVVKPGEKVQSIACPASVQAMTLAVFGLGAVLEHSARRVDQPDRGGVIALMPLSNVKVRLRRVAAG